MAAQRTLKLNTGATIPQLGLGTWQSSPEDVYDAVLTALHTGYRHIDTAFIYGNEKEVGKAIRDSGVPREDIFVTTKLWNDSHRPELVEKALETSLKNLDIGYIDLWLMHWPIAHVPGKGPFPKDENGKVLIDHDVKVSDTYAAMEKLVGDKVRAIGVSNFSVRKLEELAKTQKIVPAANQVELHPLLPQQELVDYCHAHNIVVTAYSPLGSTHSKLFKDETVTKMAEKYDATPAQIMISWGLSRNCAVIPKSVTKERIISNFKVIELKQEDVDTLSKLGEGKEVKRVADSVSTFGVDVFN